MNPLALILGVVVVVVAVYLVGSPLIRPRSEDDDLLAEFGEEPSLEEEREAVFSTLGEIEFDYQMHKLSDEDYRQLQGYYRQQAVRILKEEDMEPSKEMRGKVPKVIEEKIYRDVEAEIQAEVERELERLRGQDDN